MLWLPHTKSGVANGGAADGERLSTGSLTIGQDSTVHALQVAVTTIFFSAKSFQIGIQ